MRMKTRNQGNEWPEHFKNDFLYCNRNVKFGLLRTRLISVRFKKPKVFWSVRLDNFLPYLRALESYHAIYHRRHSNGRIENWKCLKKPLWPNTSATPTLKRRTEENNKTLQSDNFIPDGDSNRLHRYTDVMRYFFMMFIPCIFLCSVFKKTNKLH
jgi:hypothetical protein